MANENYIAKIQHNGMKESWRKKIALWFQQVRALAPSRPAPQPERRTETPAARAPPRRSQLAENRGSTAASGTDASQRIS